MNAGERTSAQAGFLAGPGPATTRARIALAAKGFLMGTADIIPGVSGGTMAFITGIYQDLVDAIRSVDASVLGHLLRLEFRQATARVHTRFLVPLLAGIAIAVLSVSRLMHHLLATHPVHIWALFFGLIAASIVVVGREMGRPGPRVALMVLSGAAASYFLVGLVPLATPEAWWFVFFCGMLAICAMILPGISGAFILLILGKYEFMTAALKNPLDPGNLGVIMIFLTGAVVGITGFSRVLSHFLHHHHGPTIALLTGFMIGALRKVWPWKDVLEETVVHGKTVVLRAENVLPVALDASVLAALGLMAAGFVIVCLIGLHGSGGNSGSAQAPPS